jgi:hypothetical protein
MLRQLLVVSPLLLAAAAGCGGGYKLAPVSGKITLNGKPLADAWVNFQPIGEKGQDPGPGSVGKTDKDGRYSLRVDEKRDGAVVGKHRVMVSTRGDKAESQPDGGKGYPDKVPLRYNFDSTLTCEIPAGGRDDANFDLKAP